MSIPKIDPYPPAPTPEDDEAIFDDKAYAHAASLELRRVQMNEVATYVNTRASDANNRAVAAAASATASANSAARADEWANKAPGSVVVSGKYSARHYSDLSDKFANAPEDVEVEPGKYSALHWKEKAKKIADVHATTVETDPLSTVLATNVQEALRDLAYQADQLRVAKNQLKYGDGPYPVMDFQFQGARCLDPRIQFTRASLDWDDEGREYKMNEPVITGQGMWDSGERTNLLLGSKSVAYPLIRLSKESVSDGFTKLTAQPGTTQGSAYVWPHVSHSPYSTGEHCISIEVDISGLSDGVFFRLIFNGPAFTNRQARAINLRIGGGYSTEGAVISSAVEPLGGSLYRVSLSANIEVEGERLALFGIYSDIPGADLSGNSIYVRRPQLEKGTRRTSYIPSEESQITVAASRVGGLDVQGLRSMSWETQRVRGGGNNDTVYFGTISSHINQAIPANGILIWAIGATTIQFTVYAESVVYERLSVSANWEEARKIAVSLNKGVLTIAIDGVSESVFSEKLKEVESSLKYLNISQNKNGQSKYSLLRGVSGYEKALSRTELERITA